MFSPVKAITAGALVFALGGMFLITQPFGQQGGGVPGAATQTEGVEPTSVTGNTVGYHQVSPGTVTSVDGIERTSGVVSTNRWSTNDARLSGDVTYNGNWYHSADPELFIQSGTYEVTNDGGTWLGEATAYGIQTLGIDMDTVILTGQDGYDGLTAYVVLDFGSGAGAISGVIFPTAMPPVPEPRQSEQTS